jgi:signal transduction histidine kinase
MFLNAHSALQVLASVENLVLALALLYILIQVFVSKKERFPVLVFLFFAFSLCLLFGLSTPNSGAILRYRAPAVLFILLAALYYLPVSKTQFFKRFN